MCRLVKSTSDDPCVKAGGEPAEIFKKEIGDESYISWDAKSETGRAKYGK